MEVFLIPVGPTATSCIARYRTSLPTRTDHDHSHAVARAGEALVRRCCARPSARAGERRRGVHASDDGVDRWHQRVKRRVLCGSPRPLPSSASCGTCAGSRSATAVFPSDIMPAHALAVVNDSMRQDFERHRFWLVVDTILFVLSGVLAMIPGPNVVAYYFAFRMVGHYLSMRGARQALHVVQWDTRPSRRSRNCGRRSISSRIRARGAGDRHRRAPAARASGHLLPPHGHSERVI
jgi:hypothetical protein